MQTTRKSPSYRAACCGALVSFVLGVVALVWLVGCAQNTATPLSQPVAQPVGATSDQAAQGNQVSSYVNIVNNPAAAYQPPGEGQVLDLRQPTSQPALGAAKSGESGNDASEVAAGHVQAGLTVNVTITGSSTGSQGTGATTGASASNTGTQNVSPTQRPEASVPVSAAVGLPGSAPTASSSAAIEGNPASTATPTNDLKTLLAKAQGGDAEAQKQLLAILAEMWGTAK